MSRKTMAALIAQANATIEDNTTGAISASDVRTLIKDFIDTLTPGFGAVGDDAVTLPLVGLTPVVIPYDTTFAMTADFTAVLAAGTVKRNALGLPTVNNRITFVADVSCQSGSEVGFSLFRDGVNVPGGTVVTTQGAGNVVQASFSVLNATPLAGDPVYEVRCAKLNGAAANVDLTLMRFILEVIPTIGP
jgi:hypothetical protein